jgi:hypothetical protein
LNKRHIYLLALALATVGLALFLYKVLVLHFPLSPETESYTWNVEAKITFLAGKEPVKVSLRIPRGGRKYTVTNDAFISRGYGLTTSVEEPNRQAVWSIRRARGLQTLYYRAEVVRVDTKDAPAMTQPPKLENPGFTGADLAAAQSLIAQIREKSADIDSMVSELIHQLNKEQPDDNVALLLGKEDSDWGKMELAVRVLSLAGVPARIAHGVILKEQREKAPLIHWVEVYDSKRWHPHNPVTGVRGLPDNYMSWWRGRGPMVQLTGGSDLRTTLSVSQDVESAIKTASVRGEIKKPLLQQFSLLSLPIHSQQVYRILLLVPVGAFVLIILRNLVGITTFGTFMPVLIALAFRETHLVWGLVFFSTLVALGLTIRFYLEHLKLLLVPRLAAILIVVVLLMALMSILSHQLGIERGLSVALFPMVILTMTIERMSIVWEERGSAEAIKQGLGSLAAASLAYLVMRVPIIRHLFFVFPELLLVLLAITILLGRYSGYRLSELWRFNLLFKGTR